MIPVRQTRHSLETIGNCYEACLASILEVPLSSIPDRADYVDADAFADTITFAMRRGGMKEVAKLDVPPDFARWEDDVDVWLHFRGLGRVEIPLPRSARARNELLKTITRDHAGYWIGIHESTADHGWSHAVVWMGLAVVHDPAGGTWGELGDLKGAHVLTAADPARIVRELGPELLPNVAGELEITRRALTLSQIELDRRGPATVAHIQTP